MPTYRPADQPLLDCLHEAVRLYHPDLQEAGVTYVLLYAHAKPNAEGEVTGPALKHHGYPAAALVRITSLKERSRGVPDVEILVDGDRWPEWSPEERLALMDHELEHPVLLRDTDGRVKEDDAGRPRLKNREHDVELGAFYSVVQRHGINALESQVYREVHRVMSQLKFPWG